MAALPMSIFSTGQEGSPEEHTEVSKFCSVAGRLLKQRPQQLPPPVVVCGKRTGRFIGGHADGAGAQGCSYFVSCLCPQCQQKPLDYEAHGGRVFTVEEFYEHGAGEGTDTDDRWRTAIEVEPQSEAYPWAQPLGAWLIAKSGGLYFDITSRTGTEIWIYWSGDDMWFRAELLSFNENTGLCKVRYLLDNQVEAVCLAAEFWSSSPTKPPPARPAQKILQHFMALPKDASMSGTMATKRNPHPGPAPTAQASVPAQGNNSDAQKRGFVAPARAPVVAPFMSIPRRPAVDTSPIRRRVPVEAGGDNSSSPNTTPNRRHQLLHKYPESSTVAMKPVTRSSDVLPHGHDPTLPSSAPKRAPTAMKTRTSRGSQAASQLHPSRQTKAKVKPMVSLPRGAISEDILAAVSALKELSNDEPQAAALGGSRDPRLAVMAKRRDREFRLHEESADEPIAKSARHNAEAVHGMEVYNLPGLTSTEAPLGSTLLSEWLPPCTQPRATSPMRPAEHQWLSDPVLHLEMQSFLLKMIKQAEANKLVPPMVGTRFMLHWSTLEPICRLLQFRMIENYIHDEAGLPGLRKAANTMACAVGMPYQAGDHRVLPASQDGDNEH